MRLARRLWTRRPPAARPLRDKLLSIGRLDERAKALAASLTVDPDRRRRARNIFPRFDDNRTLGASETGARAALPIFREIMLRVYKDQLAGPVPTFPREIEDGIDRYLAATRAAALAAPGVPEPIRD